MSDMEKILEILGAMNRRMDTMQEDISVLRSGSATKEDVGALKEDMGSLKEDVGTLKEDVGTLKEDVGTLKEDIAAHKREMATKEDLRHAKGEMMALMEAYFEPKFDLLAEQIKLIQEKQVPMEAMEQTEDRLDVLEAVVKSHSAEIRRLKKAQ
jgi:chromosome segregation ATPase